MIALLDRMSALRCTCLLLLSVGLSFAVGGCALRATTDFGPGDEPHRQSAGAGAGPFPSLFRSGSQRGDTGVMGSSSNAR